MKKRITILTTALSIAAALVLTLTTSSAQASDQSKYARKGQKLFMQYCASCHGSDGKGQGPVSIALKGGPPDLTMLQAPDQKFPFYQVQTTIDGEKAVMAHGTRKMPVWGTVFRRTKGELQKEADVYALVKYVESIQANKK
jgi:mono/diheme cytochrome c family protein